jgi:hypothetical protein
MFVTFLNMLYYQSSLPYADKFIRRTAYTLQIVLFCFFSIALLIKMEVTLTDSGTEDIYGGICGLLVISIFAVPVGGVLISPTVRSLVLGTMMQ